MNHRQFVTLNKRLDRMERLQIVSYYAGLHMEQRIMATLDGLVAEVADEKTIMDGAIVLIEGIAQRIIDAGVDATKLAAIVADMKTEKDKLAAAVLANTPPVS